MASLHPCTWFKTSKPKKDIVPAIMLTCLVVDGSMSYMTGEDDLAGGIGAPIFSLAAWHNGNASDYDAHLRNQEIAVLIFGVPIQIALILLNLPLDIVKAWLSSDGVGSDDQRRSSSDRITTGRLTSDDSYDRGLRGTPSTELEATPGRLSQTLFINDLPSGPATLEQIQNGFDILPEIDGSPNVLGVKLFTDSPVDYHTAAAPFFPAPIVETLSCEIIEEIISYLPPRSISNLALASRNFGTQFRFRRIHSDTEQAVLGQHTIRLTIHPTYYSPPVKTQWLLLGSDPVTANATWTATEKKKYSVLAAIIKACDRVSSLAWNEGQTRMPRIILETLHLRLITSIRHLDISATCGQLFERINDHMLLSTDTMRLVSLTIRGGITRQNLVNIKNLLSLTASTIRNVRFMNTDFAEAGCDSQQALGSMLQDLPGLSRIDFISPHDLDVAHIPIAHIGLHHGFGLVVDNPEVTGHILCNVTSLIFHLQSRDMIYDRNVPGTRPGVRALSEVISAAVNLRVFACNTPIIHQGHSGAPLNLDVDRPNKMRKDMLVALITREKLISLSVMGWTLGYHQLKAIVDKLKGLRHLSVYMHGEAKDISLYSQYFPRLPALVALDVAIRSLDQSCPCGHEDDPRRFHIEEGTAMGRLCRRMRLPTGIQVVRLSRFGWYPHSAEHERVPHEINWLQRPEEAVRNIEKICGPCHNDIEALWKIFDPISWMAQ
ncbi:hypothetical protein BU17DRAFT_65259 [Hysterangium stoloniferum]|nr:hypothetical protein BU17DRAFT_65259 [Hysterangium stoloniferum]